MSTDKKLFELERDIRSMHQPHIPRSEMNNVEFDRLYSQCPRHEAAYNEDDFQRIFGAGDEQQHKPIRYDQEQFDHGHKESDF